MLTIKNVIFDFDGTIVDSWPVLEAAVEKFGEKFTGRRVSQEEIEAAKGMTIQDVLAKYQVTPLKIFWYRGEILDFVELQMVTAKIVSGVKQLLNELKKMGCKLFILTSNREKTAREFLSRNGIDTEITIYSERNLLGKAWGLRKIVRQNKLKNKETVYIGDETRDIEASRRAGIKVVAVTWGFNKKEILVKFKPDLVAGKPEEVRKYVRNGGSLMAAGREIKIGGRMD